MDEAKKAKPGYIVEIDGQQFFTADFVFEQIQAQGRRIDRAYMKIKIAVVIAAVSFLLNIWILLH